MCPNIDKSKISLYIVPSEILCALKKELRNVTGNVGKRILYLAGYEGGREFISVLGVESRLEVIASDISELATAIGWGTIDVEFDGNDIIVNCADSGEAKASPKSDIPGCDITCGYLAGIVSGLLGIGYKGKEVKCVCQGDAICQFRLSSVL